MAINRRERILLVAVVAIAIGYGLFWMVQKVYAAPLAAQRAQIQTLKNGLAENEKQIQQAFNAQQRFNEWEEISLPSDEQTAQSLYLEFLYKLLRDCHVEEDAVEPVKPTRGNYFTRIPFTVTGKLTVQNLTEFLYRFYEPNLLHQVRGLTVQRTKGSDSRLLQVKLTVEGLALHSAPVRIQLLREGQESSGPVLAGTHRSDFASIAEKNIFSPYVPPRREPERPKGPDIDPPRFVYFVGAPAVDGQVEAWLYDRLSNENVALQVGDEFAMAGMQGRVTSVSQYRMAFDMDGKQWILELGKTLRDVQPAGTPRTAILGAAGAGPAPAAAEDQAPSGEKDAGSEEAGGAIP